MAERPSLLFNITLQRMKLLCSKQEKCSNEIKFKLEQEEIEEQEIEKMIILLSEENFINDERYAKSFAHDKLKFNKWGKIKIQHHLRQKGIPDTYISNALEKIDSTEYRQILMAEMAKKYKLLRSSDKYESKSRLMRFGQSRGFETELIFKIIDELLQISE